MAPSIRYHKSKFWIYYGMPDEGIFAVYAEDPLGQWSEPVLILEGKGYIDPCPFWDDDGNAISSMAMPRAESGSRVILESFRYPKMV